MTSDAAKPTRAARHGRSLMVIIHEVHILVRQVSLSGNLLSEHRSQRSSSQFHWPSPGEEIVSDKANDSTPLVGPVKNADPAIEPLPVAP